MENPVMDQQCPFTGNLCSACIEGACQYRDLSRQLKLKSRALAKKRAAPNLSPTNDHAARSTEDEVTWDVPRVVPVYLNNHTYHWLVSERSSFPSVAELDGWSVVLRERGWSYHTGRDPPSRLALVTTHRTAICKSGTIAPPSSSSGWKLRASSERCQSRRKTRGAYHFRAQPAYTFPETRAREFQFERPSP